MRSCSRARRAAPGDQPDVAFLTTSLMRSVVEGGTAASVRALGEVAGKTGTTNEQRSAWFGYTPDLVCGIYIGFDNNDPMGAMTGGGVAAAVVRLYEGGGG